jgi:formate dehydrogenase
MTEVCSATFYHHFDVVKEGEVAPPELTVRVCDTLSCAMAGAAALLSELKRAYGAQVRVIPAPCIGRCQHAPVAVVGQNCIDYATVETVKAAVGAGQKQAQLPDYVDYAEYRKQGGYRTLLAAGMVNAR